METRREIIKQTFKNMASIYNDVGQICQIIEEKMKNQGFEAMGNKAVTWETSTSLDYPDGWLHSYFARVYLKKRHPKKDEDYSAPKTLCAKKRRCAGARTPTA